MIMRLKIMTMQLAILIRLESKELKLLTSKEINTFKTIYFSMKSGAADLNCYWQLMMAEQVPGVYLRFRFDLKVIKVNA